MPEASKSSRKVTIVPFEKARSLKVILSMSDSDCEECLSFIDCEAVRHCVDPFYLIVNDSRKALPQWLLRPNVTVLNFKKDFDRSGEIITAAADRFLDMESDLLFALTNDYSPIVESLTLRAASGFKVGPKFTKGSHPFDFEIGIEKKTEGHELADIFIEKIGTFYKIVSSSQSDKHLF